MADILFEDRDIIVVRKPAGVESQRGKSFAMDLESELKNMLARDNPGTVPYLGVVHRLDRPVTGVMVYAKTRKAAADLGRQFSLGTAQKIYEAVVRGIPRQKEGELRDFLVSDGRSNMTRAVSGEEPGAKEAVLAYRVISMRESEVFSVVTRDDRVSLFLCGQPAGELSVKDFSELCVLRIRLFTGRRHQIRVQLAHAGIPVLGDTRYGTADAAGMARGTIALCAAQLAFCHPVTGKPLLFRA